MMRRREFLALAAGAATLKGLPSPKIKDVSVIATSPAGLRLVVVKVTTDQDGLYGYGCATFTQRAELVVEAVKQYLRPLILGKPADRIIDLWRAMDASSYWRNGPVLNNAISGVDEALWDIKGRQANMPVFQLLGGKCREGALAYSHASGKEPEETIDQARALIAQGFKVVRLQVGVPGLAGYGAAAGQAAPPASLTEGPVFEPLPYVRRTLALFERARKELGNEIELLHDVHERVPPRMAVQFAKDMEQFRLFYLEDALAPEDIAYFRQIRAQCATPLAMGELFNNPNEWTPLIKEQLIDYIRCHVSQVGGLTPALKVAALAEQCQVKTAWHGPGDTSPVGHCANVTLDLVCPNFGVQEWSASTERILEVFSGYPEMRDGYLFPNDKPGWGVEVNEKAAAKYPFGFGESEQRRNLNGGWGEVRRRDGSIIQQ